MIQMPGTIMERLLFTLPAGEQLYFFTIDRAFSIAGLVHDFHHYYNTRYVITRAVWFSNVTTNRIHVHLSVLAQLFVMYNWYNSTSLHTATHFMSHVLL